MPFVLFNGKLILFRPYFSKTIRTFEKMKRWNMCVLYCTHNFYILLWNFSTFIFSRYKFSDNNFIVYYTMIICFKQDEIIALSSFFFIPLPHSHTHSLSFSLSHFPCILIYLAMCFLWPYLIWMKDKFNTICKRILRDMLTLTYNGRKFVTKEFSHEGLCILDYLSVHAIFLSLLI